MKIFEIPAYFNQAEFLTDRHLQEGKANKTAIYYGERKISYAELVSRVNQTGDALFVTVRLEDRCRTIV